MNNTLTTPAPRPASPDTIAEIIDADGHTTDGTRPLRACFVITPDGTLAWRPRTATTPRPAPRKTVRDLRPGDRFLTPSGRTLTVHKTRPYELVRIEVLTIEPYIPTAPGATFIADANYPIEILGGAR